MTATEIRDRSAHDRPERENVAQRLYAADHPDDCTWDETTEVVRMAYRAFASSTQRTDSTRRHYGTTATVSAQGSTQTSNPYPWDTPTDSGPQNAETRETK